MRGAAALAHGSQADGILAARRAMLRDGEFITYGTTSFDQLTLIAAREYAFERGPKLATLR
eukprot:971009-Pleurochrysis_carterae.AAC.1